MSSEDDDHTLREGIAPFLNAGERAVVLRTADRVQHLSALLAGQVAMENGPCRFDHNGECQEHGWYDADNPGTCGTAEARKALGIPDGCSDWPVP